MKISKNRLEEIIREELQTLDEKCWKGYEKKGTKKMFGKRYPNCVKKENQDKEGKMAQGQLNRTVELASMLKKEFDVNTDLPEWVESKITKAEDYLSTVFDYMRGKGGIDEEKLTEKVTGQYKVSPKVQMHWGMDKVVIISGNKRVVLNRKEMKSLMKGVKINKLTEKKLTESWDSPQAYSSKEAKKVIDGALRNYAKELRKVQYKVIKDWMSKAKAGVIDYFDLQRGLTTGDMSRAHPYETDFLHKVLTKDKIIDRFRKYFGGKKGFAKRRK